MRVIATPRYEKDARRLLTDEERGAVEAMIGADPTAHPVIPGLGGIRKARGKAKGGGKRGGVRVIYFYYVSDEEVYLLFIYAKNEQKDLTPDQRKRAKKLLEVIAHGKKDKH